MSDAVCPEMVEQRQLDHCYDVQRTIWFTTPVRSEMLQELSHMDRITQLQDEIQQVSYLICSLSHLRHA